MELSQKIDVGKNLNCVVLIIFIITNIFMSKRTLTIPKMTVESNYKIFVLNDEQNADLLSVVIDAGITPRFAKYHLFVSSTLLAKNMNHDLRGRKGVWVSGNFGREVKADFYGWGTIFSTNGYKRGDWP